MKFATLPNTQKSLFKDMYDCYSDPLIYAEPGFDYDHCATPDNIQIMKQNVGILMRDHGMTIGDIYDILEQIRKEILRVPEIKEVMDGKKDSYLMTMGRTPAIVTKALKFKELQEVLTRVQKQMLSFTKGIESKIKDGTLGDFDPEIDKLISQHIFKKTFAASRKKSKKSKKSKKFKRTKRTKRSKRSKRSSKTR
jgi:hypothetical protein